MELSAFDPDEVSNNARLSAFRAHYGIDASASLVGGFQGQLNDSFERVQLQRPDASPLRQPNLMPRLQEDEVIYDDLAPWPTSADGAGDTLHRTRTGGWGNSALSWTGGQPGPGEVDLPGDTNLDGDVDTQDLTTAIINFTSAGGVGKTWAQGDNDGDGEIDEGYDVVSGWRQKRKESLLLRRIPSLVANRLIGFVSGVNVHDFGTTFKAYRRDILERITLYGDFHRFIPAFAGKMSAKVTEVKIEAPERGTGKSSYGFSRTWTVFFDLLRIRFLLSFLSRPLQFLTLFTRMPPPYRSSTKLRAFTWL